MALHLPGGPADEALPLSTKRRIDEVCLTFEDAWRSGQRPRLQEYLGDVAEPERSVLLEELVSLDVYYLRRSGQAPRPEDYQAAFPGHATAITGAFVRLSDEHAVACTDCHSNTVLYEERHSGQSDAFHEGDKIGRYTVKAKIADGGFGTVYLAWDERIQRLVAIKVPRDDRFASGADEARFLEEARTAAKLDCPSVVSVYDADRHEDRVPFVVMQYVKGGSLKQRLKGGPIPAREAAKLLAQVADGVAYAHQEGFVHRDLKPGNILLDDKGRAHVADFGLAVHDSARMLPVGDRSGTLPYMAPEQVYGDTGRLDGRTDIWALGAILYEMLTGRRPFLGEDRDDVGRQILDRKPRPPRQIKNAIPIDLDRICLKCLAKEQADRYATASDLARDLRRWLRGGRRKRLFAIAVMLAPLVAVGAVVLWGPVNPRNGQTPSGTEVTAEKPSSGKKPLSTQALSGTVDVLIWTPLDESRRGISLRDSGALPLRTGDRIRVDASLSRPAYVYLIWVDSAGKVWPVYPWQAGSWAERPDTESPVDHVVLPQHLDEGWPMGGRPGMETLLLLARDKPLPADVDLKKLCGDIPPQPMQDAKSLVEFDKGQVVTNERNRSRGPQFFNPEQIDDPVLQAQQRLAERLEQHFRLVRAVSFANRGQTP